MDHTLPNALSDPRLVDYLINDSALLFLLLNENGEVVEANHFAQALVGEKLPGRSLTELVVDFSGQFDLQALLCRGDGPHLLNFVSHTGLPQTFYVRFFRQGGQVVVLGEVNSLEIEQLRKSMIEVNYELGNLNRQLHKKNAELLKLSELKNHFLAVAAHDLRNPIGAIHSMSDILLSDAGQSLAATHAQMLRFIHSSSRFMIALLEDLLDVAKIESGKFDLALQSLDLVSLVDQCVEFNRVLAEKRSVTLVMPPVGRAVMVDVDPMKIEQVMHNLLSNAIKFSGDRGKVEIGLRIEAKQATVTVSDQGPGIPPQEIDQLFLPFSKTSVKPPPGEKSTGLGLSIARQIVVAHQGEIWVESQPGEGSVFAFSVPLSAPAEAG